MKQSPFKFQGNTSRQAKNTKGQPAAEHEDQGKSGLPPKNLKTAPSKSRPISSVRNARPVNTQRPKGN